METKHLHKLFHKNYSTLENTAANWRVETLTDRGRIRFLKSHTYSKIQVPANHDCRVQVAGLMPRVASIHSVSFRTWTLTISEWECGKSQKKTDLARGGGDKWAGIPGQLSEATFPVRGRPAAPPCSRWHSGGKQSWVYSPLLQWALWAWSNRVHRWSFFPSSTSFFPICRKVQGVCLELGLRLFLTCTRKSQVMSAWNLVGLMPPIPPEWSHRIKEDKTQVAYIVTSVPLPLTLNSKWPQSGKSWEEEKQATCMITCPVGN